MTTATNLHILAPRLPGSNNQAALKTEDLQYSLFSGNAPTPAAPVDVFQCKIEAMHNSPNKRNITELSDKDVVYAISYDSKHGDPQLNLNLETTDNNGDQIACRHLAFEFLKDASKTYHQTFAKLKTEKPQSLVSNVYDNEHIIVRADHVSVFKLENLGQTLYDECKCMQPGNDKKFTFLSHNHAMAVKVEYKRNCEFIMKFYDPNRTTVHKRIIFRDVKDFYKLKIEDYLSKESIEFYFETFNVAALCRYDDLNKIAERNESRTYHQIETIHEENIETVQGLIHFSRYLKHTEEFDALQDVIRKSALSPQQKKECFLHLIGKNIVLSDENPVYISEVMYAGKSLTLLPRGESRLYWALINREPELVKLFTTIILKSHIRNKTKFELLMANDEGCVPGLGMALQEGNTETVNAFVVVILGSNLSYEQNGELLIAKDEYGIPGLCVAMLEEKIQTAEAFVAAILGSNLSDEQKVKLLMATLGASLSDERKTEFLSMPTNKLDVLPKLVVELLKGNTETVKNVIASVVKQKLPEADKAKLLIVHWSPDES